METAVIIFIVVMTSLGLFVKFGAQLGEWYERRRLEGAFGAKGLPEEVAETQIASDFQLTQMASSEREDLKAALDLDLKVLSMTYNRTNMLPHEYREQQEALRARFALRTADSQEDEAYRSSAGVRARQLAATAGEQFLISREYLNKKSSTGIAVDRTNRRFALLTPYGKIIVPYSAVLNSEICVDSETVVKTDRVGQIGGAIVGGLLTGGVGALVLAMGAKKKHEDNIRCVELKILTVGTASHSHTVTFFEKGSWGSASHAMREAADWHDLISVAIREAQLEQAVPAPSSSPSIAEEIGKLADLHAKGILSDAEFQSAKLSVLS